MRGNARTSFASCAAVVLFTLLGATSVLAQPTEWAYGPVNTSDQAFRRVTPVVNCPGGGYISIGTQGQGTANPEVYLVRTNNAGAPGWERTYDIQGFGQIDEGMALAELASGAGFTLLSNTFTNVWNPALTQVDCNGNVLWSRFYPDTNGLNLRAFDLIETATGDPNMGTAPGDLVMAGYSFNGAANDGYLMRTTAGGVPIWDLAYDNSTAAVVVSESFSALTEATPVGAQIAGDVVAVGRYLSLANNNSQGFVARVDGNTGFVGAAPQCMAHHGGAAAENYFSVTELQTAPNTGQFAMVGLTNTTATLDDIWVVKGNTCGIVAQSRIGNAGAVTAEAALDVRELRGWAPAIAAIGDLVLTGYQGLAANGPWDAHLLFVRTANLTAIRGFLFGDHANRNEIGVSLAQTPAFGPQPAGFVVAGLTETNWEGFGDPRDLYLVITNAGGRTNCALPWNPPTVQIQTPWVNLVPLLRQLTLVKMPFTPSVQLATSFQVCF